jgi:hypothetical protein
MIGEVGDDAVGAKLDASACGRPSQQGQHPSDRVQSAMATGDARPCMLNLDAKLGTGLRALFKSRSINVPSCI